MLTSIRRFLIKMLSSRSGTAITVGSYITADGEHCVSITLLDSWTKAEARLSPAGAKRIAASLETWADAATQNNNVGQWQAVLRYAVKTGPAEVDPVAPVAEAT